MAEILRNRDTFGTAAGHAFRKLMVRAYPMAVAGWAIALSAAPVNGPDSARQLEAAIHKEIVLGDLTGAIQEYRGIVSEPGTSRSIAANALLRMSQCMERMGQRADARELSSRVIKEYGDQAGPAAEARARLTEMEDPVPGPLNLKFDQGAPGKLPPAWFVPALPNEADHWAQVTARGCRNSRSCAVVLVPENAPVHVGNLMQSFSAKAYRGKQVRLRAWVRLEAMDAGDHAQMWLSIDRADDRKGFFDNMNNRPVRSEEWTQCEIQTRVDADATFIKFGVMSIGRGRVWVDDVTFDVY